MHSFQALNAELIWLNWQTLHPLRAVLGRLNVALTSLENPKSDVLELSEW